MNKKIEVKFMKSVYIFIISIIIIFFTVSSSQGDIYNPKPSNDDLVLPMPNGGSMAFRPVFIGEGDKPFAMREFKVGDRSGGGYKEFPTSVVISGSFIKENPPGYKDRLYYIGKYEVTEAQYYSIMEQGKKSDSQYPINNISWFDAQEFINKYNLWLFKNAKNKLPKNGAALGFLRLPTEIEWEFAARGGSVVDQGQFDKKHPYSGSLTKYEWFEGATSSYGKLKEIGLLEPNELKLHDMLGNVSEMTNSFYRIEYYWGRLGGFVSRGGNFLTKANKIRSSERNEIPFYREIKGEIIPSRQSTLGFRLVISSEIFDSTATYRKIAAAWDEYKGGPTTTYTNVQLNEAFEALKSLLKELKNIPNTVFNKLGLLNASFKNVSSTVKKAEHDSAFAWVKVASETAYILYSREILELPSKRKALKKAEELGKSSFVVQIKKQIHDKEQNIKEGLNSYGFAFMQLEKIKKESVKEGFDKYKNFLQRGGRATPAQIKMAALVKKHYEDYFKDRRFKVDKWKSDLEKF
jgi:hypothetical protein